MLRTIQFIDTEKTAFHLNNVDAYLVPLSIGILENNSFPQDVKTYIVIENLYPKIELKVLDQLDCKKIKGFFIKHAEESILNKMNLKLRELEANQKCAFGELSIIASIDTISSMERVSQIASYARVEALYVDLKSIMNDMLISKDAKLNHAHYIKEKIILDTAKYQKVMIDACDEIFSEELLSYVRQIGFSGVKVTCAEEATIANDLFKPSQDEITTSKAILDVEYETLLNGEKTIVYQGRKISDLMSKKARRILRDAQECNLFDGVIPPVIKRRKPQKIKPAPTKFYSLGEEIANAISHGAGAVLGIVALVFLIIKGMNVIDQPRYLVSGVIFACSIIMLYLMSTLYHSLPLKRSAKQVFRRFDHASIYVLIAGSYTPFILLLLEGSTGLYVALIMWLLAITGITLKVIWIKKFAKLHLALYIALGWLPVMFFIGEIGRLGNVGLGLLIAGGVSYTVGVIFYALKLFKFTHMVWHLFCIVGTLLHFLTVYIYL